MFRTEQTHDRNDLFLNGFIEGDKIQVEDKIELYREGKEKSR